MIPFDSDLLSMEMEYSFRVCSYAAILIGHTMQFVCLSVCLSVYLSKPYGLLLTRKLKMEKNQHACERSPDQE